MRKKKVLSILLIFVILIFLYLPIMVIIFHSFNINEAPASSKFVGFTLKWYSELWKSNDLMRTLKNSLLVSTLSVLFSVLIGTPAGIVMARSKFPGKAVFENLIYLPLLLPEIILGIAFLTFYSLLNFKFGYVTMIMGHSTFCIPYVVILVTTRMTGFDVSLEDAAKDLGASKLHMFRTIILPEVIPAILSSLLLSFAMSLDDVVISFFTTGATTDTLPIKVYSMLKLHGTRSVNALCTIMVIIVFVLIVLYQLITKQPHKNKSRVLKKRSINYEEEVI